MSVQVELKGHSGASLLLEVTGYERPEAGNSSDANWLACRARLASGPFSGSISLGLTAPELTHFQEQLALACSQLHGAAALKPLEGDLEVRVEMLPRGTARVSGVMRCRDRPGGELAFVFDTDQSFLAATSEEVAEAVRAYPVR